jgi:hypothetical protein
MKRCPKCGRFNIEYDPYIGFEKCLWRDCVWINFEKIDLDSKKQSYSYNFGNFKKSLKKKNSINLDYVNSNIT